MITLGILLCVAAWLCLASAEVVKHGAYQRLPKVSIKWALYDPWIGAFHDRAKEVWYVCPLPCVLVKFDFGVPAPVAAVHKPKRCMIIASTHRIAVSKRDAIAHDYRDIPPVCQLWKDALLISPASTSSLLGLRGADFSSPLIADRHVFGSEWFKAICALQLAPRGFVFPGWWTNRYRPPVLGSSEK